jgi:hypothetical protein
VTDEYSTRTFTPTHTQAHPPAKAFMSKYRVWVWLGIGGCECMSTIFISDLHTLLLFQRLYFDVLLIYFLRSVFASKLPRTSVRRGTVLHPWVYVRAQQWPMDQSIGKLFHFTEKWFTPDNIAHIEQIYNDRMKESEFPPNEGTSPTDTLRLSSYFAHW